MMRYTGLKASFSLFGSLAASLLLMGGAQAQVGYKLDVTTHYQFGNPASSLGPYSASPDSGFFQVTNNGSTTFNGSIGDVAVSQFAGDFSYTVSGLTLAPGQSDWFSIAPESSNIGGFNGPFGFPQPGIQIDLIGTVTDGVNNEGVNLSVNDSNIHSGVPRTNPYGVTLDSYVLQGGDPLGLDTGDGYETTQADGHFEFLESAADAPEPSSIALLVTGGLPLLGFMRRRRLPA